MLLRTGEQIENDLFHIFETVELDYEGVEKKVKIDAEIIESIVSGNEFSYLKEWLKHIKFIEVIDYEIMEEDDFGIYLTLSEILLLFEFQNSII